MIRREQNLANGAHAGTTACGMYLAAGAQQKDANARSSVRS